MSKQAISKALCWKRRLGSLWRILPVSESRGVILIYHSVNGGPLSIAIDKFDAQMAWLAEHAETVSLDSLLNTERKENTKTRVAVTFDDGYRSVHDVAAPVLARYGFPATVYINSGHISEARHAPSDPLQGHYPDETFMTWAEVNHLQDQGWCIGSHGVEHLDLTAQSEAVVEAQLSESKQIIAERINAPCHHFSYTWGHHNQLLRDSVAAAGYRSAVAGVHAPVNRQSDLFALPRLDIRSEYELSDFAAIVSGKWDYLGFYQRLKALGR